MKRIALAVACLILISCGEEPETDEIVNVPPQDTVSIENTEPKDTSQAAQELAVQENALTIEDFPNKWFKLTEQNQDYVIYKYCEAETQQLWIEKEDNIWYVTVLYGQDSQRYKVIEFDAYEEERENFQVMYGSFILENPDYPDMDVEMYDYLWNKDLMFCTFSGFFQDETMMVSAKNKSNYELVKEDCDYLENQ